MRLNLTIVLLIVLIIDSVYMKNKTRKHKSEDKVLKSAEKSPKGNKKPLNVDAKDQCGRTKLMASNIVKGEKAAMYEFPWIVSFQRPKGSKVPDLVHFCGGTIINHRWILTAAHCFHSMHKLDGFKAVAGVIEWKDYLHAWIYDLESSHIHKEYNPETYGNDICLIKTKQEIEFNYTRTNYRVNRVCLPEPNTDPPVKGTVYGWGLKSEDGEPSFDLMKTTVTESDVKSCKETYNEYIPQFTKEMFCYYANGTDACKGDSGGPMTAAIKRNTYLFGIISFGLGCARNNTPGIYQEVSKYYEWIEKTIEENKN